MEPLSVEGESDAAAVSPTAWRPARGGSSHPDLRGQAHRGSQVWDVPCPRSEPATRMPGRRPSRPVCTIAVAADLAVMLWQTEHRAIHQRRCW